ncbi:unnamed protein product [Leuciscus chuanchicus]
MTFKAVQDYTSPGEYTDPDTPDELRDEDQEGDEGFEDLSFDEPLGFGAHLQCVFISFDAQVESVGPDGQAGYDHVIKLANRLVELCHQGFVIQEKVDEIVTLWDNPSEHGMATEYLECRSWSLDILNQLDPVHHEKFPVVLASEPLSLPFSSMHPDRQYSVIKANLLRWARRQQLFPDLFLPLYFLELFVDQHLQEK